MHRVFEGFVAGLFARYARELGLQECSVAAQATGRFLLIGDDGGRLIGLRPDVIVRNADSSVRFVLDTKWKIPDRREDAMSVSPADAYQLYAYASQYDSPLNVLLYPLTRGLSEATMRFEKSPRLLRTGFLNLNRNLRQESQQVLSELRRATALP